jgi:hypothetical protein
MQRVLVCRLGAHQLYGGGTPAIYSLLYVSYNCRPLPLDAHCGQRDECVRKR